MSDGNDGKSCRCFVFYLSPNIYSVLTCFTCILPVHEFYTNFGPPLRVQCGSQPAVGRGTRTIKTQVDSLNMNSLTSCIMHVTPPTQVHRLMLISTKLIKNNHVNRESLFLRLSRPQERCRPPPSYSTCRP